MLGKILQAISGTAPDRASTTTRTSYRWRCPCGSRSRNGWNIRSAAQDAAQRHQWYAGVGHPAPEIYPTEAD